MGIREEFYDSLRREYELEGERSFLYRYFQAHPQRQRGGRQSADAGRAVRTFLYDVKNKRKKDRSLAMLDAYCAGQGIHSLLAGAAELDVEEVEAFCNTLKAGAFTSILLPLRIDPGTGAGLYLLGASFLEAADLCQDEACCYACLWTDDLMLEESQDFKGYYVWSIGSRERERLREQCGFPDLREALRWFEYLTAMGQEAYQAYAFNNGKAPPNCPAVLLRYFEPGEADTERDTLIAQGRESFAREREGESREP